MNKLEDKGFYDVAIIGGGASGIVSSIIAAKRGKKVIVLERKDRILKKVLTTGNGRCNFTNINANSSNYYGSENGFWDFAITKFNPKYIIDFFESIGISPSVENRGKVYPMSGQASSLIDALRLYAEFLGIFICTDFDVNKIEKKKDFLISNEKNIIRSNSVIIATGGKSYPELGSNGSGYILAEKFSHKISKLTPVLVQLKAPKEFVKGLEGIKVNAKLSVYNKDKLIDSDIGELLFTTYGISGPTVFNLSYVVALYNIKNLKFSVDFFEKLSKEELKEILLKRKENMNYLSMEYFLNGFMPKKLGQFLTKKAGVEKLSLNIKDLDEEIIDNLVKLMKGYEIFIEDTMGFKNAQVTAGGVLTKDINSKTMESKIIKNLYFSGEVLDVFGDCGGYNLQWCWASAMVAGENC